MFGFPKEQRAVIGAGLTRSFFTSSSPLPDPFRFVGLRSNVQQSLPSVLYHSP